MDYRSYEFVLIDGDNNVAFITALSAEAAARSWVRQRGLEKPTKVTAIRLSGYERTAQTFLVELVKEYKVTAA